MHATRGLGPGCGVAVRSVTDVRQVAAGDVGQGHVVEDPAQRRPRGDPDVLQVLGGPAVVRLLGAVAPDVGQWAVQCADDVGDGDLRRRTGQPVAALGTALAGDDARLPELAEDPLEEPRQGCPARTRGGRP